MQKTKQEQHRIISKVHGRFSPVALHIFTLGLLLHLVIREGRDGEFANLVRCLDVKVFAVLVTAAIELKNHVTRCLEIVQLTLQDCGLHLVEEVQVLLDHARLVGFHQGCLLCQRFGGGLVGGEKEKKELI